MQNPQLNNQKISPQVIYDYQTHRNIPWNMEQYQPVKQYLDPVNLIRLRKYASQKKGQKDTKYLTKKGFYMDYQIKVAKSKPGSNIYNFQDEWIATQRDKRMSTNRKLNSSLTKYTYLDRIQMQQKNRATPAPGSYNLNKSLQELKQEKDKYKNKPKSSKANKFFYQEQQYLSNIIPGAGFYNPRAITSHSFRNDKTNTETWKKKHSLQDQKIKKKNHGPTPTTYKPIPCDYTVFDAINFDKNNNKNNKKKQLRTKFGTDTKFAYDRPNKKKILEKRPDPGDHNMIIEWKGKNIDPTKNKWISVRSTGFTHSIYN